MFSIKISATMICRYLILAIFPFLVLSQKLTTVQFIEMFGYKSETHYITTEDGYILTFHRIPHGINQTSTNKPAVLMVHGMCSSSADFVNLGPKRALGLILADMGYDVWLANSRGNSYSRNHTVLNPQINPKKFYNFSWHEMGLYDTPAAIDYILNLNGDNSLHYVGMSQGSTSFFVFASQRPEYNDKIKLASLMAPGTIMEHFPNMTLTNTLFEMVIELLTDLKKDHIYHLIIAEILQNFLINACGQMRALNLCKMIVGVVGGGFDDEQLDDYIIPFIGMNFPSEVSLKQFEHYLQQFLNGGFKPFDYGTKKNLKYYGRLQPRDYDLSKIKTPMAIYFGKNDLTAGYPSLKKLVKVLPPLVNYYEPPYKFFNHLDFIVARDVKKLVFDEIIRVMKIYD